MAVYERTYRPYTGPRTGRFERFWVIPRHAWRRIGGSKVALVLMVLSGLVTLVSLLMLYVTQNQALLSTLLTAFDFQLPAVEANPQFLTIVLGIQFFLGFLLLVVAGPRLMSMDLANGALPLYLSRPLTRTEYVLGKLSVLAVVLGAFTWLSGMLLFLVQAALSGAGWLFDNLYLAWAITASSVTWILVMGLLTLALSASVRWPLAVRAILLAILIVLPGFETTLNAVTRTEWGDLMNLYKALDTVTTGYFGTADSSLGMAWFVVLAVLGLSVLLITRKLRAYEVVS